MTLITSWLVAIGFVFDFFLAAAIASNDEE